MVLAYWGLYAASYVAVIETLIRSCQTLVVKTKNSRVKELEEVEEVDEVEEVIQEVLEDLGP